MVNLFDQILGYIQGLAGVAAMFPGTPSIIGAIVAKIAAIGKAAMDAHVAITGQPINFANIQPLGQLPMPATAPGPVTATVPIAVVGSPVKPA